MNIYITRHGQTDLNKAHLMQGRTDAPLNAHGRQQAVEAAQQVKGIHFDAVYSSPLKRAVDTASIISGWDKKDIITDEMKLKNIGYSLNDISIIIKNKNIKKYALKNEYDSELMDYVNTKGFDINNLSKYKEYKKNNIDASIEDTIKIVNLGLNIEYSDKLINIINHKYFINSRVNRYLEYTGKNNIAEIIKYVNCDRDREFYTKILQTNTEKGILMLVNKYYYLNDSFTGLDLVNIESNYGTGQMNQEAYNAFKKLSDDARNQGLNILVKSGYRDFYTQQSIYNGYLQTNGEWWTNLMSAKAGHSEHQTGLAVDVQTYSTYNLRDFLYTNEYNWMINNSYKYGFILRYPENTRDTTGYDFEPWHYRYVGIEAAKIIHDENLLFEEYYSYYIQKQDN